MMGEAKQGRRARRMRALVAVLAAALLGAARGSAAAAAQSAPDGPPPDSAEARATVPFPEGRLFRPLLADPKEPRFYASALSVRSGQEQTALAAVGIGEEFGLVRWGASGAGGATQLGVTAAVLAQMDLDAKSFDLINADYLVGFVLSTRRGPFTARLRLLHQSSHLGDEFLLRNELQRVNLRYESVDLMLALEGGGWRIYGGGEQALYRFPSSAPKRAVRVGAELVRGDPLFGAGVLGDAYLVVAADARATDHTGRVGLSGRFGFEVRASSTPDGHTRSLAVLVEGYDGPSPFGQFFDRNERLVGIGISVGF